MNIISIISFIIATASVGIFTYRIIHHMKKSDKEIEINEKRDPASVDIALKINQESIFWNYYYDNNYLSGFDRDCQLILT